MDIPIDFFLCQSVARSECNCYQNHEANKNCIKYYLNGAIVYKDDKKSQTTVGDIGHYLCYLKRSEIDDVHGIPSHEEWLKIDDDKVSPIIVSLSEEAIPENYTSSTNIEQPKAKIISKDTLLKMLGGIRIKSGHWSAFILLYNKQN